MTRNTWLVGGLGAIILALLVLAFWGWRHSGSSLLELALSYC